MLHFTLDPYLIMLNVKQGSIKYHFLGLWYDSTWDWTPVSQTISDTLPIRPTLWKVLEINYRVTFYVPRDWLKNNRSQAAISTSAILPHMRASFKLTSLFLLWHQRCNMESWLLLKQAMSPCGGTYEGLPNERLYAHGDPKFSYIKPLNL